jgi:hypothetical protein
VLPGMVERGKGTILFTGCSASLNGIAGYSELCKYTTQFYLFDWLCFNVSLISL